MTEWKYASVDLADNSTTVESEPCLVKGYYVTAGNSANDCPIKDDSTTVLTVPASSSVGDMVDIPPTRFETSLVVDPDDSATGTITVFYRLLREPH